MYNQNKNSPGYSFQIQFKRANINKHVFLLKEENFFGKFWLTWMGFGLKYEDVRIFFSPFIYVLPLYLISGF